MLVRFGLKVGNVKIGSMFLYILHRAIVKHGQRFIHTASSVNPTIVQKGARMWHILMPKPTHRAVFIHCFPYHQVRKLFPHSRFIASLGGCTFCHIRAPF